MPDFRLRCSIGPVHAFAQGRRPISLVYTAAFVVFAIGMLVMLAIAPDPEPKPRRRPRGNRNDGSGEPPA